jgi:integrase
MFEWAADTNRGNLLPDGFHNPFLGRASSRLRPRPDQFGEPDVTRAMAAQFLRSCDAFQLRLFTPIVLYGLRATEPAFVFREYIDEDWFKVVCLPTLNYSTKGRRDKRFPLTSPVADLLLPAIATRREGPLYTRRNLAVNDAQTPLLGASLATLTSEFERRCAADREQTAERRQMTRDALLRAAGGLTYDDIEGEFRAVHRQLGWSAQATLKDFRHLFSTCLENAGTPEHYRRFLMGHSPGKAAIVTYTHLNELKKRYEEAVQRELQPLVNAVISRAGELGLTQS